jgi:molybdate transport system regulatory protein
MKRTLRKWQGRLCIDCGGGAFIEPKRIRLLEAIDDFGSISQAARTIPLSYKCAWETVNAMTRTAGQPLLACTAGGRRGGGSRLTDYARRLIASYRALEREYQAAISALEREVKGRGSEISRADLGLANKHLGAMPEPCPNPLGTLNASGSQTPLGK